MNIWEHQALAAAEKAGHAAAATIEASAAKETKTLGATIVDDLKEAGNAIAGVFDKVIHGSQAPQSAEPQVDVTSAPQAPAAAPQDDRKATILAELHKLESEVQSLGG